MPMITVELSASQIQSYPITGLERPLQLQDVETPRIYRQLAHRGSKVVSPTQWSP